MEEIFEIRSCLEILVNDIKVDTANECMLYSKMVKCQLITIAVIIEVNGNHMVRYRTYDLGIVSHCNYTSICHHLQQFISQKL